MSTQTTQLRGAFDQTIREGGPRLTWPQLARKSLELVGKTGSDDPRTVCREMVADTRIADVLSATFDAKLLAGFRAEPDSTSSWVRVLSAENFLENELFAAGSEDRLERIPRGGTAGESTDATFGKSTYRIARFGRRIVLDDADMVSGEPIDTFQYRVEQMGAAARRVRADLVYSVLLANPVMDFDSVALFHATHGNLGTAALDAAALDAALAVVAGQISVDTAGRVVHVNRSGRCLLVPPALIGTARRLVRDLTLTDGQDIQVLAESRIGPSGLIDPDGKTLTGSATGWFLVGDNSQPSIVLMALHGDTLPTTRQFVLDRGQWGVGWDVKLDLGAKAADYRPAYRSTGAA